jgi:four helix bundle protein
MEYNKSYKELDVWKESMKLVEMVYGVTQKFPKEEMYCLCNQIRRAVISIPSNIAEGIGRNHVKDTVQFLFVARGSLYEIETQLFIAIQQKYIPFEESENIFSQIEICKKLLNGFINYYKKRIK